MNKPVRSLIEDKPVLVLLDAYKTSFEGIPRLIEAARRHEVPIIFVNDDAAKVTTRPDLEPQEYSIRRRRHSAFYGTELPILLEELGASTVILAGGETSVSVHYSFVDAHQYDYFCRVVEDCVAGSSPHAHEAALRAMEYMQTGARRRCDEVIAAFDALRADA